jgi:hypothetical protein
MHNAPVRAASGRWRTGHARRGHRFAAFRHYISLAMTHELERLERLAADSRQQAHHCTDPGTRARWEIIAAVYEKLSARVADGVPSAA